MNYKHIYMLIVEHAKSEQKLGLRKKGNGNYYEKHHILPKSLFPLWTKRKSNLVLLTAREHFFCHQLLTKIYPTSQMTYALHVFVSRPNADYKITSREYEKIKKDHSLVVSQQMKGNTYGFKKGQISTTTLRKLRGEKIIPWNKGKGKKYEPKPPKIRKPMSEETKRKIGAANKGKSHPGIKKSLEGRLNMKKSALIRARKSGYKILLKNTGEIFDCLQDVIEKYPDFSKSHILSCLSKNRKYHGKLNGQKCEWEKIIENKA